MLKAHKIQKYFNGQELLIMLLKKNVKKMQINLDDLIERYENEDQEEDCDEEK